MWALKGRGSVPPGLAGASVNAVAAVEAAIARGAREVPFRPYVYGSDEVRAALNMRQRGKCAFCETRVLPVSTPHVEHFRPKAAFRNEMDGSLVRPGYHWLAYAWSNLMLACPRCNSASFKGNRFPLRDETRRAVTPAHRIEDEEPLLVDPFLQEPRAHIRFNGPVAFAFGGSPEGRTTIDVLGLNREDLIDARNEHLRHVRNTYASTLHLADGPLRRYYEADLQALLLDGAPYRSCVEDLLLSGSLQSL